MKRYMSLLISFIIIINLVSCANNFKINEKNLQLRLT